MDIAYPDQNTSSVTIEIDVTDKVTNLAAQVSAGVLSQEQAALALDMFTSQKCVDAVREYQTQRSGNKAAKVAALQAEIVKTQVQPDIVTQATVLTSAMAVAAKGP